MCIGGDSLLCVLIKNILAPCVPVILGSWYIQNRIHKKQYRRSVIVRICDELETFVDLSFEYWSGQRDMLKAARIRTGFRTLQAEIMNEFPSLADIRGCLVNLFNVSTGDDFDSALEESIIDKVKVAEKLTKITNISTSIRIKLLHAAKSL
jgi:hypothetical protein